MVTRTPYTHDFSETVLCDGSLLSSAFVAINDLTADAITQAYKIFEALDKALTAAGTDNHKLISANIKLQITSNLEAVSIVGKMRVDAANLPIRAAHEAAGLALFPVGECLIEVSGAAQADK